jgi:GNAT superfamily N-acetyltransferase
MVPFVPVRIATRELTPELWPSLARLFGANGACGGCWCMWWRVERGGALWDRTKGAPARAAFRRLVASGKAHGILAFAGDEPVGWCAYGPRRDFPRLDRVRAYRREDAGEAWSINCFFVSRRHRGAGIARRLLDAAVDGCRRRGARLVEGYPVTTTRSGGRLAPSFAWTGPLGIFRERGFEVVQKVPPTRPLVRLRLGRAGDP